MRESEEDWLNSDWHQTLGVEISALKFMGKKIIKMKMGNKCFLEWDSW